MEALVTNVGVDELIRAREFPALIAEYARESAIDGTPPPQARIESYRALHWKSMLHIFAAKKDDELVGFITVAAPPSLHFSTPIATAESFFVAEAHRSQDMLGLRLLLAAEGRARELGSPVLLVCAPMDGKFFKMLQHPKCGYRETNRIFCKRLTDG